MYYTKKSNENIYLNDFYFFKSSMGPIKWNCDIPSVTTQGYFCFFSQINLTKWMEMIMTKWMKLVRWTCIIWHKWDNVNGWVVYINGIHHMYASCQHEWLHMNKNNHMGEIESSWVDEKTTWMNFVRQNIYDINEI